MNKKNTTRKPAQKPAAKPAKGKAAPAAKKLTKKEKLAAAIHAKLAKKKPAAKAASKTVTPPAPPVEFSFPEGTYEVLRPVDAKAKLNDYSRGKWAAMGFTRHDTLTSTYGVDTVCLFKHTDSGIVVNRRGEVVFEPQPPAAAPVAPPPPPAPAPAELPGMPPAPVVKKKYQPKTDATSKYHNRERSTVEKPVDLVRRICAANPRSARKDIIALCVSQGVNKHTAATQYSLWKAAQK
jgi:hypothetical protein